MKPNHSDRTPAHTTWIVWMALAIAGLWFTADMARADIFFWQDAGGVIHFSNTSAPPEADLYMVEPSAPPSPEPPEESANAAAEKKRDAKAEAQIEEANRKLQRALEKVDDLSDQVRQTQRQAKEAAQAAQKAAAEAEQAREENSGNGIVYAVPYRPHHGRKTIPGPYPEPYYFHHDTSKYPYYQDDRSRPERPRPPEGRPQQETTPASPPREPRQSRP
jgi:hypothetical protein